MSKVLRSIKNVTKGYSSVQVKVRDATSNDPWGPTGTQMAEIAQLTFDSSVSFYEIVDMLDKRLNDKGKNWRHVLKSLKVLDYVLHEGSDLVVTWSRKNIYIVKVLQEFQYIDEDGRDVGQNVRVAAKDLTSLILDEERLLAERSDRKTWKSRVTGMEELPLSYDTSPRQSRPQRAQRADEEDVEYQLAIAASKYQEEKDRKKRQSENEELEDDDFAKGRLPPEDLLKSRPSAVLQNQLSPHFDQDDNDYRPTSEVSDSMPQMSATFIPQGQSVWPSDDYSVENFAPRAKYIVAGEALKQHEGISQREKYARQAKESIEVEYAAPLEATAGSSSSATAARTAEGGKQREHRPEKETRPRQTRESSEGYYAKVWKKSLPAVPHDEGCGIFPGEAGNSLGGAKEPSLALGELPTASSSTEPRISGVELPASGSSETHHQLPDASQKGTDKVGPAPDVGLADVPLRLQQTQSTEESPSIFTTTEVKLGDYFKHGKDPPDSFTDIQCMDISRLLVQSGKLSWSAAPRIYIVLRLIGQLHHFDAFLDHGINDLWLPFSAASLPKSLNLAYHDEFLKRQTLVLTKAINLENGSRGHAHFTKDDPFPFEVKETLGEGGFGYVDKIVSPLSGRVFARKRFRRSRGQKKTELESFMNELKILKRLHHIHCVSLVASYTDPKYFGIIIAPVAHCDLAAFYPTVTAETTPVLCRFFGCLANAVSFLHDSKIRHRDIKPQNILVKGSSVYLTDFGISLDWENLTRSTTTKDTAKSMLYCAPEVARYEKRNTSADIWSLGCVFLEMLTIIKGKTLEEQRSLFKERSGNYRFYDNSSAAREWVDQLRGFEPANGPDQLMADVILEMLQEAADDRIPANALANRISRYQTPDLTKSNPICAECCVSDTLSISDSGSDRDPFEDTS